MNAQSFVSRVQRDSCTDFIARKALLVSAWAQEQNNANSCGWKVKKSTKVLVELLRGCLQQANLDPWLIRFTQNSVRDTVKTLPGFRIAISEAVELVANDRAAGLFAPVRVFPLDGILYTLDNRRLLVYALARKAVPVRLATLEEIASELDGPKAKFTTGKAQRGGLIIEVLPTSPLVTKRRLT